MNKLNHLKRFNESDENLNISDVRSSNKNFYIVERRKDNTMTEDANCFLGSSMDKVVDWINNNKDFDKRDYNWYWVVIKIKVDDEFGGELFKIFDWDGNELEEQPRKQ
jgi:hypothetical protein